MTGAEKLIQEQVDMLVSDLAQMRERAEQAEAELAEMTIERDAAQRALYDFEQSAEAQNVMRAQGMIDAAFARAERAEAVLGAVPWQTLLNIYECLTLPAVALDGDVDTLASFLNQYAPWVPNESEERDDMEPPNRDFTTTGDFRRARGVIPWLPGDEPAETTIRRLRDAPERAELAEAVVSAIPWQSLLNIYESRKVSDRDEDALGVFLGVYLPAHFYRKSESEE